MRAAREFMDGKILDWAAAVTADWLREPMTWTSRLDGFTQTQPRGVLVTQMFNHQTHPRGQITTLLSPLGVDVGVTDLPRLPVLNG